MRNATDIIIEAMRLREDKADVKRLWLELSAIWPGYHLTSDAFKRSLDRAAAEHRKATPAARLVPCDGEQPVPHAV